MHYPRDARHAAIIIAVWIKLYKYITLCNIDYQYCTHGNSVLLVVTIFAMCSRPSWTALTRKFHNGYHLARCIHCGCLILVLPPSIDIHPHYHHVTVSLLSPRPILLYCYCRSHPSPVQVPAQVQGRGQVQVPARIQEQVLVSAQG